jgi:hypothetical protein
MKQFLNITAYSTVDMNSAQENYCSKVSGILTNLKLGDEYGDCDGLENVLWTKFV